MKKLKDITVRKRIDTLGQSYEIFEFLGRHNTKKYNLAKLAEELNELSDVCLKIHNKKPDKHPSKQAMIDEIGDVKARIKMIMVSQGITNADIRKRHLHKANKYLGYLKENKYDRGI